MKTRLIWIKITTLGYICFPFERPRLIQNGWYNCVPRTNDI